MRTRFMALGCLVVFVIVLVVLGGAALFAASLPPVSQQLPPDSAPLLVHLTTPLDSGDVPLDSPTSIQAEALGASAAITSIELWVDGNPAETTNAQRTDLKLLDAIWSWQPDSPGEHTLVARASDAAHRVVSSNVVRVNATQADDSSLPVNYQVVTGDTLASISQKSGASVDQLAAANAGLNPAGPIAVGQTISVPQTVKAKKIKPTPTPSPTASATSQTSPQATPQPAAQPGSSQSLSPLAGLSFWAQKNLAATAQLPSAPLLTASANGCNAVLSIVNQADALSGFFVYRTFAGNPQFTRIATMEAAAKNQPQSFTDSNVAGPLEYYVAAFNPAGESPSKIVSVSVVDSTCALSFATGALFKNGQVVPTQPVDKAYCYLSENSGPWSRVPPAPNTFILPTNGVFDVSAYLKSLAAGVTSQMTMDLDCWGWMGSSLTYLGEAKQTFTPQSNGAVQLAGDRFKFVGAVGLLPNIKPFDPVTQQIVFPAQSLNSTGDPTVCAQHMDPLTVILGGAQLCASTIQQHQVVLVWNWTSPAAYQDPSSPNTKYQVIQDIAGYRVYENDTYFQHSLVATSTAGPNDKVTMFPLPVLSKFAFVGTLHGFAGNRCFVVRAYKGTLESTDSNTLCLGSTLPGTTTQTLTPSSPLPRIVWNWYSNCNVDTSQVPGDGIYNVGYYFIEDFGVPGCGGHQNIVVRSLTRFDLGLMGPIWSATLTYHLNLRVGNDVAVTTYYDNADGRDPNRLQITAQNDPTRSCAVYLMLPTQDWVSSSSHDLVPADDYTSLPEHSASGSFSVDVTSAVRRWQQYGNYGFEFAGAREDTGAEENSACISNISIDSLQVTFFP